MEQRALLSPIGLKDNLGCDMEVVGEPNESFKSHIKQRKWQTLLAWISIGVSILALGFMCGALVVQKHGHQKFPASYSSLINSSACTSAPTRREWRSLSVAERDSYINAVKCLNTKPSRLASRSSLYNDFAYVHKLFDKDVHFAASFLPWHRYFIHTYHRALVDECNYSGELPYWEWTLDWEDLFFAPVWDQEHGFSGNGTASSEPSPLFPRSHCVSSGPFANFQVVYGGSASLPHCLTRDFGSGESMDQLMQNIGPSALEKLLLEDDYYRFLIRLEAGPHLSIPKAIMGDFSLFTAPNDPVFFLHHAQLDRIWWLWEQYDLPQRQNAYGGSFKAKSEQQANAEDVISIGSLAPTIKVKDLLDIQSDSLCYRY